MKKHSKSERLVRKLRAENRKLRNAIQVAKTFRALDSETGLEYYFEDTLAYQNCERLFTRRGEGKAVREMDLGKHT